MLRPGHPWRLPRRRDPGRGVLNLWKIDTGGRSPCAPPPGMGDTPGQWGGQAGQRLAGVRPVGRTRTADALARATGGEDPAVRWPWQRVPETRAAYSDTVITALVSAAHGGGIGRCESAPKRDLPSRGLGAPRCARSTNNHATAAVCVGIVVVRPRLQLHPRFGHRQGRIPQ